MTIDRRKLLMAGTMATFGVSGPAVAQYTPGTAAESMAEKPADTSGVPNNEKRINIVTLRDLQAEAKKVMAPC